MCVTAKNEVTAIRISIPRYPNSCIALLIKPCDNIFVTEMFNSWCITLCSTYCFQYLVFKNILLIFQSKFEATSYSL